MTAPHQKLFQARVIATRNVAPEVHHIRLHEPDLARWSSPGQFVMLRAGQSFDPLLPRPLSLCGAEEDCIELLVRIRGAGTAMIVRRMAGQTIEGRGPLGNGFRVPPDLQTAYLAAGGIGIAPLLFLARRLRRVQAATAVKLFMGAADCHAMGLLDQFALPECSIALATEDGSQGYHGLVSELVDQDFRARPPKASPAGIMFACGPHPMARAVAAIARRHGIVSQLSLEARMACGVGACLGCVVSVRRPAGPDPYKRACCEGPVFDGEEIDWESAGSGAACGPGQPPVRGGQAVPPTEGQAW